jgi:large subunit ribosomal protein L18e
MKKSKSTNPVMRELIKELAIKTQKEKAPIWRDLSKRLSRSSSKRAQVNVSRIARYTKKGDIVVVPGKVLGAGSIGHPIVVGAFNFSVQAVKKITSAGGKCITLMEMMRENPKGTNIKIVE